MPILNYTTSVKAEKTVGEIQGILQRGGAQATMVEYAENEVSAVSFRIDFKGQLIFYRLPARVDGVYNRLCETAPRRYQTYEQATRVAWRIVKDWVEAQLALVEAEQAQLAEVFLAFATDSAGQTIFEKLESNGFMLLTHQDTE